MWCNIGNTYASVLPLPVSATATKDLRFNKSGIARAWISVALDRPCSARLFLRDGRSEKSEKDDKGLEGEENGKARRRSTIGGEQDTGYDLDRSHNPDSV